MAASFALLVGCGTANAGAEGRNYGIELYGKYGSISAEAPKIDESYWKDIRLACGNRARSWNSDKADIEAFETECLKKVRSEESDALNRNREILEGNK